MNILSVTSFVLAAAVFLISALTSTDNPMMFVDYHGALIVIGGSIAATAISFQLDRIMSMLKVFWDRTLKGGRIDYRATIHELMTLADAYLKEDPKIKDMVAGSKDEFLREVMTILLDEVAEDEEEMMAIIFDRVDTIYARYSNDAMKFKAMGKYPPAMGLMGAVLGMIALLGSLGKPGAEKTIGPAMSVALVATLYGIAMANLVVIPIGENLAESAKELKTKNSIIAEGVRLISQRKNPILLAERLNSFLLPHERIDYKTISQPGAKAAA